jgi:hypothetical protein
MHRQLSQPAPRCGDLMRFVGSAGQWQGVARDGGSILSRATTNGHGASRHASRADFPKSPAPWSARSTLRTASEEKLMPMKPARRGGVFDWSALRPPGIGVSVAAGPFGVRWATPSAVSGPHRFRLFGRSAAKRLSGQRSISRCASRLLYDPDRGRKREQQIKVKRYVAKAAA